MWVILVIIEGGLYTVHVSAANLWGELLIFFLILLEMLIVLS